MRGATQLYRLVRGDLVSLEVREPLRWLHVRRQRHLVSEPRACVRADSLRESLVRRQPAGLAGVAQVAGQGRSMKCTVLRFDKFYYFICRKLDAPCSLAGYVCVRTLDCTSASKYAAVGLHRYR